MAILGNYKDNYDKVTSNKSIGFDPKAILLKD